MKFLILFVCSGVAALILGPFIPYWGIMLSIAVLAAILGGKGVYSFFSAGLGMGLVWYLIPLMIQWDTESTLPERVAQIMGLEHEGLLLAATSFLGFLMGGLAALTGNLFRKLFEKDKGFY